MRLSPLGDALPVSAGRTAAGDAAALVLPAHLAAAVDDRTLALLERRRLGGTPRRGWVVRRLLLLADLLSLPLAFLVAALAVGNPAGPGNRLDLSGELALLLLLVPVWVLAAKLHGLYDRDEERANHSTADEFAGVFHVFTAGTWLVMVGAWLTGAAHPAPQRAFVFWAAGIVLVTTARAGARALARRSELYLQNAVVVGAGDVGQLLARKLLQHPEYGINLVGFVDADPRERRGNVCDVPVLGCIDDLRQIVSLLDVERVIVSFSNEAERDVVALVRSLRDLDVQVDVVPRLFEVLGPRIAMHTVENVPLVGLPPARIGRSSRFLKRAIDVAVAVALLLLTAPLFAFVAWRIKRDSPGPVFFRQTRVGLDQREFTVLKFRTMRADTDDSAHRTYIRETMDAGAAAGGNGLYKLERQDAVTPFGRWLRRTSLDELPQLVNVLGGDMSLVGPRPCIPYETENFQPHHFERFLVPAGITGLWQVTARARSTFGEALEMDVAYVRGWSLGLDLKLLFRTPFELLRQRVTA